MYLQSNLRRIYRSNLSRPQSNNQHKKMVYPCGPISHERHPIVIFEEWEAMGMFDNIFESDPIITCADSNSDRNSIISYISTTPDEVAVQQFNQSLSTVSTISPPPSSGASLKIVLTDPLPSTPKASLKVQSPSSSQDDGKKHLESESAPFSKVEENKKEKGPSTIKKPTETTPISHVDIHVRNKSIKKRRVSYVSKAAWLLSVMKFKFICCESLFIRVSSVEVCMYSESCK